MIKKQALGFRVRDFKVYGFAKEMLMGTQGLGQHVCIPVEISSFQKTAVSVGALLRFTCLPHP